MPLSDDASDVFDLPPRLHAKGVPDLIGDDRRRFAQVASALAGVRLDVETRLARVRREPAGSGQQALERDLEVQRLSGRSRLLGRFGLEVCIGKTVDLEGRAIYVGRFGVSGSDEQQLIVDWRAPAAAPFFAASGAQPMGLALRRRYRWVEGRIVDYWDEVFAPDGVDHTAALDDQSAFIASLAASRSPKMRDVLATIQADQDAVIRADARLPLVVDGGPGTGKTVVALHRAAYLLSADPRLAGNGGLLFVGPHRPYVDYVDDVLPSLGEDGVRVCAVSDLVPGASDAVPEPDAAIRRIKSTGAMVDAVEAAVRLWQRPPGRAVVLDTAWGSIRVTAAEWAEIFAGDDGVSHNASRTLAWDRLLDLLVERIDDELRDPDGTAEDDPWAEGWGEASRPRDDFDAYGGGWDADGSTREALENDEELRAVFDGAWPALDPEALLRGLLASAAMLRRCAPGLADEDVRRLAAAPSGPWTDADLPLLDAARLAVGDPRAEARAARGRRDAAAARRVMSDVVSDLIAADDGDLRIMSMLRGQDLRHTLEAPATRDADPLVGPFAHLVVDEAQELTDAQWRMLLRRCPSRALTIVGDRAQARHGFPEGWRERLARVGVEHAVLSTLVVNYRTPEEVMAVAGPVIRAAVPDANVPVSIRRAGVPVGYGARSDLDGILDEWERTHPEGVAVVIGDAGFPGRDRVRSSSPELVTGLEFDLVVLVDPERFGAGVTGAVDTYVAMTRATQRLVVLRSGKSA
ncbi:MAG: RNA polymerase recycling motor ATPase HelR [Microbacterium sp.]|uniref:RNA polymerase recycling motor ATPase HelR n=1 Tax=Microbacterium sp. TaxID=51671 RepID=UPI0039E650FE